MCVCSPSRLYLMCGSDRTDGQTNTEWRQGVSHQLQAVWDSLVDPSTAIPHHHARIRHYTGTRTIYRCDDTTLHTSHGMK